MGGSSKENMVSAEICGFCVRQQSPVNDSAMKPKKQARPEERSESPGVSAQLFCVRTAFYLK